MNSANARRLPLSAPVETKPLKEMAVSRRSLFVFSVLAYTLVLHYLYLNVVQPTYSYRGLARIELPPENIVLLYVMILFTALFVPLRIDRPSRLGYLTLYLFNFVPSVLVLPYSFWNRLGPETVMGWLTLMMTIYLVINVAIRYLPLITDLSLFSTSWSVFWPLAIIALILGAVFFFTQFGFRFTALEISTLTDVRDIRLGSRDELGDAPTFFGYILSWLQRVINPLTLILGVVRRRPLLIIAAVVIQFGLFGFAGQRSALAVFALVGMVLLLYRWRAKMSVLIIWVLIIVLSLGTVADLIIRDNIFTALLSYRTIIQPSFLTGLYYEYFSTHTQLAYSTTLIGDLLGMQSPYIMSYQRMLGLHYFNDVEVNVNANIWADGYANAGIPGVVFTCALLIGFLWILDCVAAEKELRITLALIIAPCGVILTNTSFATAFLTGGLFLIILLTFLLPKQTQAKELESNPPQNAMIL
jgi:hypothetical protein